MSREWVEQHRDDPPLLSETFSAAQDRRLQGLGIFSVSVFVGWLMEPSWQRLTARLWGMK